jgi:hypothetical protein
MHISKKTSSKIRDTYSGGDLHVRNKKRLDKENDKVL